MDLGIVWSGPAIDSLGAIVAEVAQHNPRAAFELGSKLIERMEVAAQFPEAGPLYQRAKPIEVRCLTTGNYRLYYRAWLGRHQVEVLAVRHCAREQPDF
jgi:plasmid stabilization system protein ParE